MRFLCLVFFFINIYYKYKHHVTIYQDPYNFHCILNKLNCEDYKIIRLKIFLIYTNLVENTYILRFRVTYTSYRHKQII